MSFDPTASQPMITKPTAKDSNTERLPASLSQATWGATPAAARPPPQAASGGRRRCRRPSGRRRRPAAKPKSAQLALPHPLLPLPRVFLRPDFGPRRSFAVAGLWGRIRPSFRRIHGSPGWIYRPRRSWCLRPPGRLWLPWRPPSPSLGAGGARPPRWLRLPGAVAPLALGLLWLRRRRRLFWWRWARGCRIRRSQVRICRFPLPPFLGRAGACGCAGSVAGGAFVPRVAGGGGLCHAAALRLSLPPPSWRLGGRGPVSPSPPHWWLVDRGRSAACAALVEPGCRLGMAWRFLLLVKTMFVLSLLGASPWTPPMPPLLVFASRLPSSGLPWATVAAIRPGIEIGSLVKTMSGARTDAVGVQRVMVPVEGVVLGLLHAQGGRHLDVTYRAPLMLHHLGLLTLQLP
ncbi:uncharacterized protein LOC120697601 isoform X1 [Panicum virgatum]|uniref:uncharacterized protein LOC120697601 isoform X1 n=1 Tax=Panicum virgatum TaxID=38727 RepID=UPI0019D66E7C|nr:uncharacterized protein LOC120697601 isoform X1 [Panicum virgatum]